MPRIVGSRMVAVQIRGGFMRKAPNSKHLRGLLRKLSSSHVCAGGLRHGASPELVPASSHHDSAGNAKAWGGVAAGSLGHASLPNQRSSKRALSTLLDPFSKVRMLRCKEPRTPSTKPS